MISKENRNIVYLAIQSRLLIFILQVLFNFLMPDHKANAFNPPIDSRENFLNRCTSFIFSGLTQRWDANHFIHISHYGYIFQNQLAFFPLYPLLVGMVGKVVYYAFYFFVPSEIYTLMVVSTVLNFVFFVVTAVFHYQLGIAVLGDRQKAFHATQLFCVNPASIFFSASYSESLFSMLSFGAMLLLEKNRFLSASILVAFCGSTRSNGLLIVGFLIFKTAVLIYSNYSHNYLFVKSFLLFIFKLLIGTSISVLPFLAYQNYSYNLLCYSQSNDLSMYPRSLVDYAKEYGYTFITSKSSKLSICKKTYPALPYSAVQEEFWNVGLFKYYEWKQLPNFVLAAPILFICLYLSVSYFLQYFELVNNYKINEKLLKKSDEIQVSVDDDADNLLVNFNLLPYVLHMLFIVLFSVACIHIQVSTRMLCSSCPIIYWLISIYCSNAAKHGGINEENDQIIIEADNSCRNEVDANDLNNIDNLIYSEIIGEPYTGHFMEKSSQRCHTPQDEQGTENNVGEDAVTLQLRHRKPVIKSDDIYRDKNVFIGHNDKSFKLDRNSPGSIFKNSSSYDLWFYTETSGNLEPTGNNCCNEPDILQSNTDVDSKSRNELKIGGTDSNNASQNSENIIFDNSVNIMTNIDREHTKEIVGENGDINLKSDDSLDDIAGDLNKIEPDHGNDIRAASFVDDIDIWNSCYLGKFVNIYFHMYFFVGTAAFSNFLPWT